MLAHLWSAAQSVRGDMPDQQRQQIESFVNTTMAEFGVVPGLGVAIVQGDQIIYAGGFGYRDVEQQLPVTAETGFYLASTSKSFLGMAAAQLEHQKQLDLAASLADYFPGWQLPAPLKAEDIRLTDLLSHNHGLRNGGLQFHLAFIGPLSPEDQTRILFDFSQAGRPGFAYSNTSYNIVGRVMEQISGRTWQEIVETQVFQPLGMKHSTALMSEAAQRELAYPYYHREGTFHRLEIKQDGQMQSAGGHVSTPMDLARWLLANMNEGQLGGQQLIPQAVMERVHQPYATLERDFFWFKRQAYQLGWYESDYEGDQLNHHFGSFNGYMAHTSYMPEHQLGVVVLGNELELGGQLPHLVAAYIYDLLLEKEDLETKYKEAIHSWQETLPQRRERMEEAITRKADLLAQLAEEPKPWGFESSLFPGTYYNPRLGHMTLELEEGKLRAQYGVHRCDLMAMDKNQFLADWAFSGTLSPPINLDVSYGATGEVVALDWGGREFRRIATGQNPAGFNDMFQLVRSQLEQIIGLKSEAQMKAVYDLLQTHYPSGGFNENYVNQRGYGYLSQEEWQMALAFFQFNVDHYPKSANAYDSLGEGYLEMGDKQEAKRNYEESLRLDPDNEHARKVVEDLNNQGY